MILAMSKVQVLGARRLLPEVLAFLQQRGVLDLRSPASLEEGPPRPGLHLVPLREGEHTSECLLSSAVDAAVALMGALPATGRGEAQALPDVESPDFLPRVASLDSERRALEDRAAGLREERQVSERYGRLLVALAPLRPSLPGPGEAHAVGLVMHRDPRALALLDGEIRRITGGNCSVQSRPAGDELLAVLVSVPREHARAASALLFERGVEEIRLPSSYAGQPLIAALQLLVQREREIPGQIAAADRALHDFSARVLPALHGAVAEARTRLARLRALARCGETRHAFVVTGWLPRAGVPVLEAALRERFDGRVVVLDHPASPRDGDDVPVILRNPALVRPFERLLALVPPPRYGTVDPTPWLALFFPLFFGLVLGDVGFGVLGGALSLVALWRKWGGAAGREYAVIALACSASALLFGVLFGEAFGDLGSRLGMHPLLLHRRVALLAFLGIAVGVGLVHVALGTAIGAVHSLRHGHAREGIARLGRVVLLAGAAGAAMAVAALLPRQALVPALGLAGAGALLSLAGGPMALLDLVLSLGNVLSYARLMALGVASAMLADVANQLATAVHPVALGVALALLLHAVNFTLGIMSPLIASLRLHYVEFFEKFYEAGGRPYQPFARQT